MDRLRAGIAFAAGVAWLVSGWGASLPAAAAPCGRPQAWQAPPVCAYPEAMRRAGAEAARNAAVPPASSLLAPCAPAVCNVAWEVKADVTSQNPGESGLEGAEAAVIGDKIYVAHGHASGTDLRSLRIYDIATDSWSFGPDAVAPFGISEGVGIAHGGKLYALGGRGLPANQEYDPATTTWTVRALMPTGRKGMAVGVIDDRIHVVGGSDGSGPHAGTPMAVHEVYDPATDTWSAAAPLPIPLADIYAAVVFGRKLYVFGGFDGAQAVATTHVYDAATDTWSTAAPMPTARSNAVAGVLCGKAFVIGGLPTGLLVTYAIVEVYDPVTDTWCSGPSKPRTVAEGATTAVSTAGAIYVIGSGHSGNSQSYHEALVLQSSCLVSGLSPIRRLLGARRGAGAEFTWDPDPNAPSYHLNTVRVKSDIGEPASKLAPVGTATNQCDVAAPPCTDPDAIADGTLLFYQVFSACGATGADEGPFE